MSRSFWMIWGNTFPCFSPVFLLLLSLYHIVSFLSHFNLFCYQPFVFLSLLSPLITNTSFLLHLNLFGNQSVFAFYLFLLLLLPFCLTFPLCLSFAFLCAVDSLYPTLASLYWYYLSILLYSFHPYFVISI